MCVFKKHLKTSWIASSLAEIVTDPFYILCPQKFGTSKLFGLNFNSAYLKFTSETSLIVFT